jgi:hypothetical protein
MWIREIAGRNACAAWIDKRSPSNSFGDVFVSAQNAENGKIMPPLDHFLFTFFAFLSFLFVAESKFCKFFCRLEQNLSHLLNCRCFRFAFKSPCDDRSAMFQWMFVNDDDALLPTFNGDIIAECHNVSDSE